MNISTGGPHILLFERDQQLTGLLISEFQLAGYECHTARTAVEVFDAIARQPIRLILVNLAQAAAARREFWVALDTQRRGRGIQVLTFHCSNIANYGPKDPDEQAASMVDLEVDGMMGIMNLVDGVRARVPVSNNSLPENSLPRVLRSTGQSQMHPGQPPMSPPRPAFSNNNTFLSRENGGIHTVQAPTGLAHPETTFANETSPRVQPISPVVNGQNMATNYQQSTTANNNPHGQTSYVQSNNPGEFHPLQTLPPHTTAGNVTIPAPTNGASLSPSVTRQSAPQEESAAQSSYPDKIRAILYPNQRAWNPQSTNGSARENPMFENAGYSATQTGGNATPSGNLTQTANTEPNDSTVLQRLASGQIGRDGQWESGLAQLSRMVQERNTQQENTNSAPTYQMPKTSPGQETGTTAANIDQPILNTNNTIPYTPPQSTPQGEPYTENLGTHTLRASPIQDLPGERGATETNKRPDLFTRTNYAQQQSTSQPALASLSAAAQQEEQKSEPMPPKVEKRGDYTPTQTSLKIGQDGARSRQAETGAFKQPGEPNRPTRARMIPEGPLSSRPAQEASIPLQNRSESQHTTRISAEPNGLHPQPSEQVQGQTARESNTFANQEEERQSPPKQTTVTEEGIFNHSEVNKQLLEKAQAEIKVALEQHTTFDPNNAPSNALLLDIMQSLPPMPAPTQQMQAQVLSGRATRSLGSVLLEGHLVPQNRLEVAQNVQRMLRGVDLNYQLGEILLMFKLLTPDQLLAASLVSYGMINPTQITALGRIRQELHAIGLEYDLENLLIMFRILTPEQLREVRASW